MPLYEYRDKLYDIASDDADAAVKQIRSHLQLPEEEYTKADTYEKSMLANLMGMSQFFGGVTGTGGVGDEAFSNAVKEKEKSAQDNPWTSAGGDITTTLGPLIASAGALAIPAAASGGAAALTGLGGIGTGVATGAMAAPFVGPQTGAVDEQSYLNAMGPDATEDQKRQAKMAGIAGGTINAAANLIPVKAGGLLSRFGQGAAINMGMDVGAKAAQNAFIEDPRLDKDLFDPKSLLVSGLIGGITEGVGGTRPGERILAKDEVPNPYNKPPSAKEPEFTLDVDSDIFRRINVLKSQERAINEHLSRQDDPNSDYSLKLREELYKTSQDLLQLEKIAGNKVEPTTTNPATEQKVAQNRVDSIEQEINSLKTEYNSIKSKGAAITKEDKARLDIINSRVDALSDEGEMLATKAFGEEVPNATQQPPVAPQQIVDTSVPPTVNKPTVEASTIVPGLSEKASKYLRKLEDQLKYFGWKEQNSPGTYTNLIEKIQQQVDSIRNSANRPEFVPGATKTEVHQKHGEIDISSMSDRALENAVANKQRKIDNVQKQLDSLQANNANLDAQLKAMDFKRMLENELDDFARELEIRKTANDIEKAEGTQLSAMLVDNYVATTPFVSGARGALQEGGIVNALTFIKNFGKTLGQGDYGRFYGQLANVLLKNPLIENLKHRIDPNAKYGAQYNNMTGEIVFKSDADITPSAILHETVHAMVNKAVSWAASGFANRLDIRANVAARRINDLYKKIMADKKLYNNFVKVLGEHNAKNMLENVREFVTYGMSDYGMQNALRQINVGGKSSWSILKDTLKNWFGDSSNTRTALDDVLEYGQQLIALSDAQAPKLIGSDPMKTFRLSFTPESVLMKLRNGSMSIFSHMFTSQIPQMLRHDPHASMWFDTISKIQWKAESLKTKLLYGTRTPNASGKGFFFKLKGPQDETALVPIIQRIAKDEDIAAVHDKMIDGYEKGIPHEETIKANEAGWTPDQTALAKSLAKNVDMLAEEVFRMYGRTGLDQNLKQRIGYMLTQRVGDYTVTTSVMGIPLRSQSFLTAGEANYWMKKYAAADKRITVKVDTKARDMTQNLMDFIESLKEVPQDQLRNHLNNQLMHMEMENTSIGSHTIRSSALPGFVGDQAGLSAKERGKLLRDALPRSINNYVENIYSREIQKSLIDFHIENDAKMKSTTREIVDFYTRSQIDRPYRTDRVRMTGETGEHVPKTIREGLHDLSTSFREWTSNGLDKHLFGYHMRDKHAIDRFLGMFSSVFYIANITMKPAIWLAQPLQALMSVRSAFKQGEDVRQVMTAFGEAMTMMAKQRWDADPEFLRALDKVSQEHNTLHPQMNNEFNSITFGHNPNSILNKTVDFSLGRTISAAGDKFSRFASFTFFYNLHKHSGLTGDELIQRAAKDATDNMIAYGSKNMPAIYRETGIFGEQAAPLMTFAHGQLGNMIVDIKEFVKTPGFRSAAPLILSAGMMMILGGAVSLPLLAEYELIRLGAISIGLIRPDQWPSAAKAMIDYTPSWVSHGAISGATGVDVDASMRYTSLFKKISDVETQGMLAFFPHINWGMQAIGGATTITKSAFSDTPKGALDKAWKQVAPKGPVYGAIDYLRNKDQTVTTMGPKGHALVERGTAEKVAPWIGSRSVQEAKDMTQVMHSKEMQQAQKELESSFAQLASEGYTKKAKKIAKVLVTEYYMGDSSKLENLIKNQVTNANIPAILRMYMDSSGAQSPEQEARFLRDNGPQYFKNRTN